MEACNRCRWTLQVCMSCNPAQVELGRKRKLYESLDQEIGEVQQEIFDLGEQKRQLELHKVGLKVEITKLEKENKLQAAGENEDKEIQVEAFQTPERRLPWHPRRPRWKELKAIAKEAETLPATQVQSEEDIRGAK